MRATYSLQGKDRVAQSNTGWRQIWKYRSCHESPQEEPEKKNYGRYVANV